MWDGEETIHILQRRPKSLRPNAKQIGISETHHFIKSLNKKNRRSPSPARGVTEINMRDIYRQLMFHFP